MFKKAYVTFPCTNTIQNYSLAFQKEGVAFIFFTRHWPINVPEIYVLTRMS